MGRRRNDTVIRYAEIRRTTSNAVDTMGWPIVSLWITDNDRWSTMRKAYSCKGGGYDMRGTVFADLITAEYPERLHKLRADEHRCLVHYNTRTNKRQRTWTGDHVHSYVSGGSGMASVTRLMEAIGIDLERVCLHSTSGYKLHVHSTRRRRTL